MESTLKLSINTEKWLFTYDQWMNTPSRKQGLDAEKELKYRQESASLISDAGQVLKLSMGLINSAVVYMHRFYMYHSILKFHRYTTACTALYLAAKVGNDFRKYEHVYAACIKFFDESGVSVEAIKEWKMDQENIFFDETIMLQTLGFEVDIELPHTHIIKCLVLINADKNPDISKTSYLLATQLIQLTTFSIHFESSVIACIAIYITLKWTNWEIHLSSEGKEWFSYVESTVTIELMDQAVEVFLDIYRESPCRMRRTFDAIYEKYNNTLYPKEILLQEYMKRKPSDNSATRIPMDLPLPKFSVEFQTSLSMAAKKCPVIRKRKHFS
ncbi:Similar to Ccnt1: Cyclin-T1 (Mus musculus) [Cotesia congregata]|uniref:Similar to Ccnt1: Cyclin-T1 (Mus musculus) n=1 Tax=Cotesia congregata TaxID=51543 RepID=A0A8J2MFD9_COTCN|nr:Similar to Ccnt1: Cyclin-T1 (Mus musculus) [Cotesia congregata]